MTSKTRNITIMALGENSAGKTCLLRTCAENKFPTNTITQPIFDIYEKNVIVDGEEYNMTLQDTPGYDDDYCKLLALAYRVLPPMNTCCLICYTVSCKVSYEKARMKWAPEIKRFCPHIPIVLVATQIDQRTVSNIETITTEQGIKLMHKIKAKSFVECSAKTGTNVPKVFEEAVRCSIKKNAPRHTKCVLL